MNDDRASLPNADSVPDRAFSDAIGSKVGRKLRARRNAGQGVWFGLGTMGIIGWSIVVPTLLGAGLGVWLDGKHWSSHSWTLPLLVAGLVLGCANAWHWVANQDRAMRDMETDDE